MNRNHSISAQDSRGRSSNAGLGDLRGSRIKRFGSSSVVKSVKNVWSFLRKRTNLSFWIIIAVIIGIVVGKTAPDFSVTIGPLGTVFIRMIQCIVGPLIFSTLVIGIAGHGSDLIRIGRLALKSVIYFEVVSTLALIVGIIAVNIARPGDGFSEQNSIPVDTNITKITWVTEMELIVPTSFFLALTDHTAVLAVVFCAIMFSVAVSLADEKSKNFMLDFNASLSAIMFKIVDLVMNYAPIGIGCSIASTVGQYGLSSLATAGKLVATLYLTLIIFIIVVILPIVYFSRIPLKELAMAVGQPFLMAFATSSSESALPTAMENMVEFGVPADIAAFVIPTGYSFNLDGSTLYLSIAVIFCAQVAGVNKTIGEQIVIILTLMLTSKGVAAVPRAAYIVLASSLGGSGIPLQGLALVTAVDAFLDMARTSINVLGNMIASAVIAKWEGEFRNESWMARRSGQMPETLAMDEPENENILPLHQPVQASPNQTYPNIYGEKDSIHSVESLRTNDYDGAYNLQHHHQGPSSQRPFSTYTN
ncbi:hypothetical protein BGZ46_002285, partial [Entomortierella lignicola]